MRERKGRGRERARELSEGERGWQLGSGWGDACIHIHYILLFWYLLFLYCCFVFYSLFCICFSICFSIYTVYSIVHSVFCIPYSIFYICFISSSLPGQPPRPTPSYG